MSGCRQTSCKHCGGDIENFWPYRRGEWRDRGSNPTCNDGRTHAPYTAEPAERYAPKRGAWWGTSSGSISLRIRTQDAKSATHSGPCDSDVASLSKRPYIARQLAAIPSDTLAAELREYGAWDTAELKDYTQNLQRLLWLACGDLADA